MKKRVGFFGGSFDPIHFGHIQLALDMFEEHHLDEVLFCPCYISPFKLDHAPLVTGEVRLQLVNLAIHEIPHFKSIDLEVKSEGPSFTIDTIKKIASEEVELFLILSEESASGLSKWKNYQELIQLAKPLIGRRGWDEGARLDKPFLDISSTLVRERLKKKLYCGHLVPRLALDFILKHQLYS
jgi:nicotinate-nucleotide adenylyltransferase